MVEVVESGGGGGGGGGGVMQCLIGYRSGWRGLTLLPSKP